MSPLDRTLEQDPTQVVRIRDSDVYHKATNDDPLLTECAVAPDPAQCESVSETEAIERGFRRCERCDFGAPLMVHVAGAKNYHLVSMTRYGKRRTRCSAVADISTRQDARLLPVACLEHNGLEPCKHCEAKTNHD